MAVHRLPSIHMSSAFHDRKHEAAARQAEKDTNAGQRIDAGLKLDARALDQSSWTRSPSLALKRPAYSFPLHDDRQQPDHHQEQRSLTRASFEGYDAVLSPSLRKRRRGDSDMSMSGRGSGASPSYGSVHITSTSIRAVVRAEDVEYSGRDSWAGASSRGSGRDSDLFDGMPSPHTEQGQTGADESSSADRSAGANASRTITFPMLQTHFSKPLKDAANHFGVCTTLLKKICRKNGIVSWPYRQIIGLEKSIASMEQQVHYFDGEQRRQYAGQLRKLQIKLEAYIRTGQAPSEDELVAALSAEANAPPAAAAQPRAEPAPEPPLHKEYYHRHHQPHVGYYYAPQGSVMASAVTLDAEEPPQRYETHARPTSTTSDHPYDQRYAATTSSYTSPSSYYAPRALPSLASLLHQPTQQPPAGHFAAKAEPRQGEFDHPWRG